MKRLEQGARTLVRLMQAPLLGVSRVEVRDASDQDGQVPTLFRLQAHLPTLPSMNYMLVESAHP